MEPQIRAFQLSENMEMLILLVLVIAHGSAIAAVKHFVRKLDERSNKFVLGLHDFVVVRRRRDSARTPEERKFCENLLRAMYATCAAIPVMVVFAFVLFALT